MPMLGYALFLEQFDCEVPFPHFVKELLDIEVFFRRPNSGTELSFENLLHAD